MEDCLMKKFKLLAFILAFFITIQIFPAYAATVPASSPGNNPQNIFEFSKTEVPEIYFTNQSSPIYLLLPSSDPAHAEIVKALAETKGVRFTKYNPNSGVDAGFFVISKSGKKNINMRPGNIIEVDGVPYGTTTKQYTRLVELGNDDYKGLKKIAQWCASMTYTNITKIEYSSSPKNKLREIPAENVRLAAKELHEFAVKEGTLIFPNSIDLENWTNRTKVVYTFKNGVQYLVYANNAFLFIECEGMTYSCQYSGDYSAYVARMKELASKPVQTATSTSTTEIKASK